MNFKPNDNFLYFLYFMKERMDIFWKRFEGNPSPYSEDILFQNFKFTNVYRILDRSSQFLIKEVIQNGKKYSKEDMFWRIILYKHFNLPDTWIYLENKLGDITSDTDFDDIEKSLKELSREGKIYSNAYMLTASFMRSDPILNKFKLKSGMPKYKMYLNIFKKSFFDEGIMKDIIGSKSMEDAFNNFKRVVSIADFLAYQFVQDINYSDIVDFSMNEFCAAGPGTRRGLERCFDIEGTPDYGEMVIWVYNNLDELRREYSNKFEIDLTFRPLPNFNPQVPDLSNCFCETDKYLRGAGIATEGKEIHGKRIKASFKPSSQSIDYVFPNKFNVII